MRQRCSFRNAHGRGMLRALAALLAGVSLLAAPALQAQPAPARTTGDGDFSIGMISHGAKVQDETLLRVALEDADEDNLAFVVVNGMKHGSEACNDSLYQQRRDILESSRNGLVYSIAASDWADCRNSRGSSNAIGRLSRVRELMYTGDFSLGGARLPVVRQSTVAKFRSYVENMRWDVGDIMFATLNLPANNNNFLPGAGRNSEFEDRLIASREWLQRLFAHAARKGMKGIVFFTDGDPGPKGGVLSSLFASQRDGYAETWKLLAKHAETFKGKVLLVHGQPPAAGASAAISWKKNLGVLAGGQVAGEGWTKLTIRPGSAELFFAHPEGNAALEKGRDR